MFGEQNMKNRKIMACRCGRNATRTWKYPDNTCDILCSKCYDECEALLDQLINIEKGGSF